ncbi:MAG: alpha/beta hydrolase [Myxococcota bacterium]|nr:alpha/beta hydrolase [Myxococcota bacterium]
MSEATSLNPVDRRIPAADGLSLHMVEWTNTGVPLLFVHGYGNDAHIWDDVVPDLAPHYAVHSLDWRGHGDSDWHPEGAYDWDDHVRDLDAVVAHMGWERFVLCGHSLGGRVSTLFAGNHPEKLAGLVIVDTGPEHDPRGQVRIRMETESHPDPTFASIQEYEAMLAHQYIAATSSAIKRMAKYGLRERDDGRFELKMDSKLRDFGRMKLDADELERRDKDLTERLWSACETVPCPVLVVRGAASDILSADTADKMVEDVLQNGTLEVIARASHSVMTDNPDGFRKAIRKFALGEE